MNKTFKKYIDERYNSLKQMNEMLDKLVADKSWEAFAKQLIKCQEFAIALGEILEQATLVPSDDSPETGIVHMLEEYCEVCYETYEESGRILTGETDYGTSGRLIDTLNSRMTDIISEVGYEIGNKLHIRKEVVFLPYKAAMWDSLESVWLEADRDSNCDAYVIPIPYYDKAPDGSFRTEHYEVDMYPDNVPVIRYDEYDFELRRPDEIYIHNPYDDSNYVTSVHPYFYSKNLKQFTDCLVYIPYFILDEVDPDNAAAVAGIAHFCTVKAVVHAHKVIVQSENFRQIYINEMTKLAGENTRAYWEKKIYGTGSPKLDKVFRTKIEDIDIPDSWRKIIYRPDNTRKKIIFYNVSVVNMINNGEELVAKIMDVLKVFYDNRETVALLWRPHPLMQATIDAMKPALMEKYKNIVDEYKASGWGIYDDTPELNRAIALCDAYYGDGSSVVQLCRKAGKPVMIQDVNIRY